MSPPKPTLFYDLGSPYAYLAVERADRRARGRASPGTGPGRRDLRPPRTRQLVANTRRNGRIAEVKARAERYGLPPLRWPPGWPNNTLKAMRSAVWANQVDGGQLRQSRPASGVCRGTGPQRDRGPGRPGGFSRTAGGGATGAIEQTESRTAEADNGKGLGERRTRRARAPGSARKSSTATISWSLRRRDTTP